MGTEYGRQDLILPGRPLVTRALCLTSVRHNVIMYVSRAHIFMDVMNNLVCTYAHNVLKAIHNCTHV